MEITPEQHQEFIENVEKKLEDNKTLNKFEKSIKSLENLLDCRITCNFYHKDTDMEDVSNEEENINYPLELQNMDFWNNYNSTMKELLEYNIDIENKEIFFDNDIDIMSPKVIETKIKTIEKLSQEEDKEITISISSYGGDVYSTLGIIDVIRLSESKIKVVGKGQIMSGAALILITSPNRILTKNSILMLHNSSTGVFGDFEEVMNSMEQMKKIQNTLYNLLVEHSNKNKSWWKNKLKKDLFLTAEECKDLGLIDEII